MNTQTVRLAFKTGKAAYDAFTDYRDRKTAQAYEATSDMLDDAAKTYRTLRANAQELASDVSEEIGNRSQELVADTREATKDAKKKLSRFACRKASKQVARQTAKQAKKKGCFKRLGKFALFGTLFSAIAGVVYLWWATRPIQEVGTEPPRVEEHSGPDDEGVESRLVYSTETLVDDDDE